MTEEEWLTGQETYFPRRMLRALQEQFSPKSLKISKKNRDRKLRLFGCECCRRLRRLLVTNETQTLLEVAERYADGLATKPDLRIAASAAARAKLPTAPPGDEFNSIYGAYDYAARATYFLGESNFEEFAVAVVEDLFGATVNDPEDPEEEGKHQKAILLDLFGNPFRPVAFSPSWRTSAAVALAAGMYEGRDFAAMPILADALQEAGCDHAAVLDHCRGPGPHVRGCWVVDHVLGKA